MFFCPKIGDTGTFVYKMNFLLFYELPQLTIRYMSPFVNNSRHVPVCMMDAYVCFFEVYGCRMKMGPKKDDLLVIERFKVINSFGKQND